MLVWLYLQVPRYRRSSGERRQQLKWLDSGAVVFAVSVVISALASDNSSSPWQLVGAVGMAVFPVCIGVAVLKYRLYEIDRIISRVNRVSGNCQDILVLDDGQPGGAGNAVIVDNNVFNNNKFCAKSEDTPVNTQGGGILLLGATQTLVTHNLVTGNKGKQFNSGGIVVLSARAISHGSNPNFDTIARNTALRNRPADLIWDGTGIGVRFRANDCQTSIPSGFCH